MSPTTEPEIRFLEQEDGATRVELRQDGRAVSWLWILPYTIRVGAATVRMDGIGGVGTEEGYRRRGLSRRVLDAAVERMRQGDAALTMLYGIPGFYPKFGYATAGPDHLILLEQPEAPPALPPGWSTRSYETRDLPALQRLYDRNTVDSVGTAVRTPGSRVWSRLLPRNGAGDECRVVLDPAGEVAAYVWRGSDFWYVKKLEKRYPAAFVLAEVMAGDAVTAGAALAACRAWAAEEGARRGEPVRHVLLAQPPAGPVAAAARFDAAEFLQNWVACGDSMARVLDVRRLLEALQPELSARLTAARRPVGAALRLETDLGSVTLSITGERVRVLDDAPGEALTLRLPQGELARLALGAFPPDDILDRLPSPPADAARQLIRILFPYRHQHMHLPDRY